MAAAAQDEFVDLYEVLELATEADSETIRKRLNTLYLEAQQNLDHRNVKKRLKYQQMYEIYLPQARHLLLDKRRRAEYDLYLNAYRSGSKVEAEEEKAVVASAPPPGTTPEVDDTPLPGMVEEEEVDPEVLAAEREDMWAKWKQGLQRVTEEAPDLPLPGTAAPDQSPNASHAAQASPAPAANVPPSGARPAPPVPRSRPTPPAPRTPDSRPAPPAPRRGQIPGAAQQEQEAAVAAEMEKKREQQRYTLIKSSVQNAGLLWGAITAGVIFFLGCIIMFILDGSLTNYPLNLSRSAFAGICFLIVLIISALGGLIGRRKAKRRTVGELSILSLEELMRRNR